MPEDSIQLFLLVLLCFFAMSIVPISSYADTHAALWPPGAKSSIKPLNEPMSFDRDTSVSVTCRYSFAGTVRAMSDVPISFH